jgi:hypothetical protein
MSNRIKIFNSSFHFIHGRKCQRTQKISLTYLDNLLSDDYLNVDDERLFLIFLTNLFHKKTVTN